MANKKISELAEHIELVDNDLLHVIDSVNSSNKKLKWSGLQDKLSIQKIGNVVSGTGFQEGDTIVWDNTNSVFRPGSAGEVKEAPSDNKSYVRHNEGWTSNAVFDSLSGTGFSILKGDTTGSVLTLGKSNSVKSNIEFQVNGIKKTDIDVSDSGIEVSTVESTNHWQFNCDIWVPSSPANDNSATSKSYVETQINTREPIVPTNSKALAKQNGTWTTSPTFDEVGGILKGGHTFKVDTVFLDSDGRSRVKFVKASNTVFINNTVFETTTGTRILEVTSTRINAKKDLYVTGVIYENSKRLATQPTNNTYESALKGSTWTTSPAFDTLNIQRGYVDNIGITDKAIVNVAYVDQIVKDLVVGKNYVYSSKAAAEGYISGGGSWEVGSVITITSTSDTYYGQWRASKDISSPFTFATAVSNKDLVAIEAAGIPEAPVDSKTYLRSNNAWTHSANLSALTADNATVSNDLTLSSSSVKLRNTSSKFVVVSESTTALTVGKSYIYSNSNASLGSSSTSSRFNQLWLNSYAHFQFRSNSYYEDQEGKQRLYFYRDAGIRLRCAGGDQILNLGDSNNSTYFYFYKTYFRPNTSTIDIGTSSNSFRHGYYSGTVTAQALKANNHQLGAFTLGSKSLRYHTFSAYNTTNFDGITYNDTTNIFAFHADTGINESNADAGTATLTARNLTLSSTLTVSLVDAATVNANKLEVNNEAVWYVSTSNSAHQRMDARIDGTNEARLHCYGKDSSGGTRTFKQAWYDGSAYINVTASARTVSFVGASNDPDRLSLGNLGVNTGATFSGEGGHLYLGVDDGSNDYRIVFAKGSSPGLWPSSGGNDGRSKINLGASSSRWKDGWFAGTVDTSGTLIGNTVTSRGTLNAYGTSDTSNNGSRVVIGSSNDSWVHFQSYKTTSGTTKGANLYTNVGWHAVDGFTVYGKNTGIISDGYKWNNKLVHGGTNDAWLRLNPLSQFGNGVYCGNVGVLRHDRKIQVGSAGPYIDTNTIRNTNTYIKSSTNPLYIGSATDANTTGSIWRSSTGLNFQDIMESGAESVRMILSAEEGALYPSSTYDSISLGTSSNKWSYGYFDDITSGRLTIDGTSSSAIKLYNSSTYGTYMQLQNKSGATNVTLRSYTDLDNGAVGIFGGHLIPVSANSHSLGTTSKRWNSLAISGIAEVGEVRLNSTRDCRIYESSAHDLRLGAHSSTDHHIELTPPEPTGLGLARFSPASDGTIYLGQTTHRWYKVYSNSGTIGTSDERVKDNIEKIPNPLETVNKLNGYVYDKYNNLSRTRKLYDKEAKISKIVDEIPERSSGVLAQELLEVFPCAVEVPKNPEKELYGVNYSRLTGLLIEAIKELKAEIDELKK